MDERYNRRRLRSRSAGARAWLADSLHQPALRTRPVARHIRGLQEAALPMGLWRFADSAQALALPAAPRQPIDAPAEARIFTWLAPLARSRIDRGCLCHGQSCLA